jgi:hypothetical protein
VRVRSESEIERAIAGGRAPDGDFGGELPPEGEVVPRSDRDRALTRLLRRDDVIATADLGKLGYSRHEVTTLCEHGDLIRLHRGVYADGRTRLSPWTRLRAALLATGSSAFLSHRAGAAARGYRNINPWDIHVTVIATSTPRLAGLSVHRTTEPGPGEVTRVSGLRVSSVPRILVELSATAPRQELDALITAAERRNALGAMEVVLARHARRPGIGNLRAALEGHLSTPGGNSHLEADVWAWYWTQPDLPPPDETNIRIGPFEFDGIWRRERLVLEIDSRSYHQAKADMEKDRVKDAYVQKLGLRILRVTDFRFEADKPGIRTDLLAFLGRRRAA